MINKIMFTVFYNPITKDIYTEQDNSVYIIQKFTDTDKKTYDKLSKKGYILKDVTENGIGYTLSYAETFCCCDRCGKLFVQDNISFTDKGASYCNKCYTLHKTYDTYFQCLGLDIISRGDYESMPCPMHAGEFDDKKMTQLAKDIYLTLTIEYGYTYKELEKYFNNKSSNIDENLDTNFWCEMENIAVQMGMRYYEDITDIEFANISKK